jgi:hypothetical protein
MSNRSITKMNNSGSSRAGQMPYKRHSQDIARELEVVRGVLADYERLAKENDDNSPSTLFAIHSLEGDLKWLNKQFFAAEMHEKQYDGELVFRGKNFDTHTADATFFAEVLLCIQKLTTSFSSVGVPHRLRFNTSPGSFRVHLHLQEEKQIQPVLDMGVPVVYGLDTVVSLLDHKTDFAEVAIQVVDPAVRRHYAQLLDLIVREDVEFELRTQKFALGTVMLSSTAKDWSSRLGETTDVYQEDIAITGILKTGSVIAGSCLIQSENGEKYRPRVDKEHAPLFRGIPLDSSVRVVLQKTATHHSELTQPIITHRLQTIELLNAPKLPGF